MRRTCEDIVIVITGASSGIDRTAALACARAGRRSWPPAVRRLETITAKAAGCLDGAGRGAGDGYGLRIRRTWKPAAMKAQGFRTRAADIEHSSVFASAFANSLANVETVMPSAGERPDSRLIFLPQIQ
ncbi:hypothetical protein [Methylocaldum marinum]|nr:hypothetical protein [Methylocaldum marinum]